MRSLKAALKLSGYVLFLILLFGVGLKLVDKFVLEKTSLVTGRPGDVPDTLGVFEEDIYPYTGGHTQSNFRVSPTLRSGDHGFFVDFDLDAPPPKRPGEFRLILTGGSAAAGWGATGNDAMLYRQLEALFSRQKPCGPTLGLTVVNLAMGDSMSYQNYIALNRWGHGLKPDMIMSYSGLNDINVTYRNRSDAFRHYDTVRALNVTARHSSSPAWLKWFGRLYPGLIKHTAVGPALRTLNLNDVARGAEAQYLQQFPPVRTPEDVFEQVTKPLYVHALRSIKRDFLGIPMVIVFQPYTLTPNAPLYREWKSIANPAARAQVERWRLDVGQSAEKLREVYEGLKMFATPRLRGYMNDDWTIIDMDRYYREKLAARFPPGDGVHLGDEQQRLVAEELGRRIFPLVCRLAAREGLTGRPRPPRLR